MMNLERTLSSKGSLANRFALWVAFMTLLVIAGLGVYFDHFLRTSFLESAKTRIAYGYERLSYNLDQIETGLKDGVAFLRVDKTVLASINLINLYEDRKRYNSFLIDEEKKALAEELLNKVKFSFNDSIVLYGKNMDVIAYVAKGEVGYHLNIVSYKNGRLTLLRRYEHEVEYREVPHSSMQDDGVQHEHINYYTNEALLSGTVITRHHAASGLVLRSHLRLLAEEGAPVAHIEMSRVLGGGLFSGSVRQYESEYIPFNFATRQFS